MQTEKQGDGENDDAVRMLYFAIAKLVRIAIILVLRICYGWPPVAWALYIQQSGVVPIVRHGVSFKGISDSGHAMQVARVWKSHDLRLQEFSLNVVLYSGVAVVKGKSWRISIVGTESSLEFEIIAKLEQEQIKAVTKNPGLFLQVQLHSTKDRSFKVSFLIKNNIITTI